MPAINKQFAAPLIQGDNRERLDDRFASEPSAQRTSSRSMAADERKPTQPVSPQIGLQGSARK
jgi:hypothetical protein